MIEDARRDLLLVMTGKVRVAGAKQLAGARPPWNSPLLTKLVAEGLLKRVLMKVVLPEVSSPVCRWQPGQEKPNLGAISWQARKRLRQGKEVSSSIYWATQRAARVAGGVGGRLRQPWQIQHDLGVAAYYLTLHREDSPLAEQWMSEDVYRRQQIRRGEKIADAYIRSETGRLLRVVEFVGNYPKWRLEEFHTYWAKRGVAYELV